MCKQIGLFFGLFFLVSLFNQVGNGAIITSQLGDIDNFQSGNAADALFRSQTILDILVPRIEPSAYKESDFFLDNWDVGYTHVFDIPPGQTIIGATLTIGILSDGFALDGLRRIDIAALMIDINVEPGKVGTGPSLTLRNLPGYSTPPPFVTEDFVIDLSQVPMSDCWGDCPPITNRNLLPELEDGELNIWGFSDMGIDYSLLEIEIVPEPLTLSFLALGGLVLRRRRRRI